MRKIGLLTIGQAPREDILSAMVPHLTHPVDILQRGALDGLDRSAISALQPAPGQPTLVTNLRDGTEVRLSPTSILPLLQESVEALVREGAELVVLLCTDVFPDLRSRCTILYPGRLLQGVLVALAQGAKLGVILPAADQVALAEERHNDYWPGLDVVITSASPYAAPEAMASQWQRAARELQTRGVDMVYLDCMAMSEEMKGIVQQITQRPVILARSIVARVVDELIA